MDHKVLVIDDEVDFLNEMSNWLGGQGYQVSTAENGDAGLDAIRSDKPDLVVLDVSMPQKDGFTVLSELRRDPECQRVPVVMLTATSQTDAIMKAQRMGAVDYFIKPFDQDEFLRLIRRYERSY